MMNKKRRRSRAQDAELDITSFMNLMIILVPVLLLNMVFSPVRVLNLQLPDAAADSSTSNKEKRLELIVRKEKMEVFYPQGYLLKTIPKQEENYDYVLLSSVLQEVKRQLSEKKIEKKDVLILSEKDVDYQTLVHTIDTARSYKAVVALSEVDAELFPKVALGDAPLLGGK